jgi:hypothetical protein
MPIPDELREKCLLTNDEIANVIAEFYQMVVLPEWITGQDEIVPNAQLDKAYPIIESETQQVIIDALLNYANGKISFERCAELMNMNFYELKMAMDAYANNRERISQEPCKEWEN